jgi:hypothetical protein
MTFGGRTWRWKQRSCQMAEVHGFLCSDIALNFWRDDSPMLTTRYSGGDVVCNATGREVEEKCFLAASATQLAMLFCLWPQMYYSHIKE